MTPPELPPLDLHCESGRAHAAYTPDSVEARERILTAEIERLRAEVEAMRSVLSRFDERWLMDGELGFCVVCGNSIEGGEAHKPDCWLSEAIDAARSAP